MDDAPCETTDQIFIKSENTRRVFSARQQPGSGIQRSKCQISCDQRNGTGALKTQVLPELAVATCRRVDNAPCIFALKLIKSLPPFYALNKRALFSKYDNMKIFSIPINSHAFKEPYINKNRWTDKEK